MTHTYACTQARTYTHNMCVTAFSPTWHDEEEASQKLGCLVQAVSTRACYLFSRLVKALRQNIRQFVREVLHSIQGHLVRIATHPPTDGGQAAAKAGGPGGAKITTMGAFLPATDDRYLNFLNEFLTTKKTFHITFFFFL